MPYCSLLDQLQGERLGLHKAYHDERYCFPIHDDNELFCRLVLETLKAKPLWAHKASLRCGP